MNYVEKVHIEARADHREVALAVIYCARRPNNVS